MLSVILTNIIGFSLIYVTWCFIEWKIMKIKSISEWSSESRVMLLVGGILFTLFDAAIATC